MKLLKKIIIVIVIIIAIPLIAAFFINGKYAVVREVTIKQPNSIVFNYVKHLKNQDNFSVWSKMDPVMKKGFTGTDGEVGAIATWESDSADVGKGEQEIIKIEDGKRIDFELRFLEPFEATDNAYFTTEVLNDNETKIQWGFDGEMKYPMNLMMLFMDMEEMLAPDLQIGLDNLKKILEDMKTTPAIEITEETVDSHPILFISESSSIMPDSIGVKMGEAYGELMALMGIANIEMASPPIAITKKFSLEEMVCEFDAAIPVVELSSEMELSGRIQQGNTYAGKTLKAIHVGSYSTLKSTYDAIIAYIAENGYEKNGFSWEEYIDDPGKVAEEKRRTVVYFPIK